MTLDKLMQVARSAIRYTNSVLPDGPVNSFANQVKDWAVTIGSWGMFASETQANAQAMRKRFAEQFKEKVYVNGSEWFVLSFPLLPEIDKYAKAAKTGCCGEFATVTFQHLRSVKQLSDENVRIELVAAQGHWMVVINRNTNSSLKDPFSWNEDSVICDAWKKDVWSGRSYYHNWSTPPIASLKYPDGLNGSIKIGSWQNW